VSSSSCSAFSRSSTRTFSTSASASTGLLNEVVGARLVAGAHDLAVVRALIITTGSVGPVPLADQAQVSSPDSPAGSRRGRRGRAALRQQLERLLAGARALRLEAARLQQRRQRAHDEGSSSTTRMRASGSA